MSPIDTSSASLDPVSPPVENNTVTMTVAEIVEMFRNETFFVRHEQDFIWSSKKSKLFINSLMKGIPTSRIRMCREVGSDRFYLEDGYQRLVTIEKFLENGLRTSSTSEEIPPEYRNKLYSELPLAVQHQIKDYSFYVFKHEDLTLQERFNIFEMLNMGYSDDEESL